MCSFNYLFISLSIYLFISSFIYLFILMTFFFINRLLIKLFACLFICQGESQISPISFTFFFLSLVLPFTSPYLPSPPPSPFLPPPVLHLLLLLLPLLPLIFFFSFSFLAPEVLSEFHYTRACDIYSLGVVIFILLSGTMPFNKSNAGKILVSTSTLCVSVAYED